MVDARMSAASDAAVRISQAGAEVAHGSMTLTRADEPRHSTARYSEGLAQGCLQGSSDQATSASEPGAEPGRGYRLSAADVGTCDQSLCGHSDFAFLDPVGTLRIVIDDLLGQMPGQDSSPAEFVKGAEVEWLAFGDFLDSLLLRGSGGLHPGLTAGDAAEPWLMCKGSGRTIFGPCNMCL